jgi:LytS/YehU family sensor histidine kinase
MEIIVQDNGTGIVEEPIQKSRKSIGLANVRDRMRLHYGDGSIFEIESFPSVGTRIIIFIPDESG